MSGNTDVISEAAPPRSRIYFFDTEGEKTHAPSSSLRECVIFGECRGLGLDVDLVVVVVDRVDWAVEVMVSQQ